MDGPASEKGTIMFPKYICYFSIQANRRFEHSVFSSSGDAQTLTRHLATPHTDAAWEDYLSKSQVEVSHAKAMSSGKSPYS